MKPSQKCRSVRAHGSLPRLVFPRVIDHKRCEKIYCQERSIGKRDESQQIQEDAKAVAGKRSSGLKTVKLGGAGQELLLSEKLYNQIKTKEVSGKGMQESKYERNFYEQKEDPKEQGLSNLGRWTFEEQLLHTIFVDFNANRFSLKSQRKKNKIFKQMSLFVKTRNPIQCRSHYQKLQKKYKNIQRMVEMFIRSCGADFYAERFSRLTKNTQIHITELGNRSTLCQEEAPSTSELKTSPSQGSPETLATTYQPRVSASPAHMYWPHTAPAPYYPIMPWNYYQPYMFNPPMLSYPMINSNF